MPSSETVAHPKPRRYYRPELDALRAFAFLSVFYFHQIDYFSAAKLRGQVWFDIQNSGSYGLPLFFFLSAFLIVELLFREKASTGTVHVRQFYIRRILRIWPLYFLVLIVLSVVAHWFPLYGSRDPRAWLAFSFFAGNWYIFKHWWIADPFDPLWSISAEEQFYLTVPWMTKRWGRRGIIAICIVFLVVAYALIAHYWTRPLPTGPDCQWVNSFFVFQFFAGGALLSVLLRGRSPRWPGWLRVLGFLLALVLWFTATHFFGISAWMPPPAHLWQDWLGWLCVLAGCALLITSVLGVDARRVPRPLTYLGRISYAAYLFHMSVVTLTLELIAHKLHHPPTGTSRVLGILFALCATFGLASLSYRFYEGPFLKLKQRFTLVPSRPE